MSRSRRIDRFDRGEKKKEKKDTGSTSEERASILDLMVLKGLASR
jgi:hypothetical protein